MQVLPAGGLETRRRCGYGVVADLDRGEGVAAAAVGLLLQSEARVGSRKRHLGIGDYRTGVVGHGSCDCALIHLSG